MISMNKEGNSIEERWGWACADAFGAAGGAGEGGQRAFGSTFRRPGGAGMGFAGRPGDSANRSFWK